MALAAPPSAWLDAWPQLPALVAVQLVHVDVRVKTKPVEPSPADGRDPAFAGIYSLLATDQGVRGFLQVSNDVSFDLAKTLDLTSWVRDHQSEATETKEVNDALQDLGSIEQIASFVKNLCRSAARFDWSSSVTPDLPEPTRNQQALYRAGSGYREVRRQLLLHLSRQPDGRVKRSADRVVQALNFNQ